MYNLIIIKTSKKNKEVIYKNRRLYPIENFYTPLHYTM